jgi:peptidyl-prolyl cis-trans isomerase B (cyclophilin B)
MKSKSSLPVFLFFRCLITAVTLAVSASVAQAADDSESAAIENPQVLMKTSLGEIVVELYADKAPNTVANFIQYVTDEYYNGTVFHRVIDGFMIQGGGFDAGLNKQATRDPIDNEADNGLKNDKFTIAMARTQDPNSASAQFFINVADNDFLNHKAKNLRGWGYAVFGTVVSGQDVVEKIATVKTGASGPFGKDVPKETIAIESATLIGQEQ